MRILNASKGALLADQGLMAKSFFARMKGLIGRKSLCKGEGLVIPRCQGIHMVFMRFPIDAIFVNRTNQVVALLPDFKPYQISAYFASANFVIELPNGIIAESKTTIGDFIFIED